MGASSSGEGQARRAGQGAGSGRRDTGHGKRHGQRHGKDAVASGKGKGVADRGRDTRQGPGGRREGAHPNQGQGAGRGLRGKGGKVDMGPRGQAGQSTGSGREGQGTVQGKGGWAPPQPDVQAVRCIPPGIKQMPAHHAHHYQQPIYNIDPDMGVLIPPPTPRLPHRPAPCPHGSAPHGPAPAVWEPRADPARMAAAPAARVSGEAPAQQVQEPRAEPARGAEGARNVWARDWDAIPAPLGGEALCPPPDVLVVLHGVAGTQRLKIAATRKLEQVFTV